MITLHHSPGSASMAPHLLLLETGAPFELRPVDLDAGEHRQPAYLKLNPNGHVPLLTDGDLVLYESAAICLHLADAFPAAGLAPPLGSAERGHFYKWLVWLTNTLQPALIRYFYPERMVEGGDADTAAKVQRQARADATRLVGHLDAEFARHGGPWLLGERYSAADAYAFMLCRWTRNFPEGRARDHAHLMPFLQRMLARPAWQKLVEVEGLQPPLV